MKTKKAFDCVEMKRRGAEAVRRRLAGMTPEQELEFWRQETEDLRRQQQELQRERATLKTREPNDRPD